MKLKYLTNQLQPQPFYGHCTGQPALVGTVSQEL